MSPTIEGEMKGMGPDLGLVLPNRSPFLSIWSSSWLLVLVTEFFIPSPEAQHFSRNKSFLIPFSGSVRALSTLKSLMAVTWPNWGHPQHPWPRVSVYAQPWVLIPCLGCAEGELVSISAMIWSAAYGLTSTLYFRLTTPVLLYDLDYILDVATVCESVLLWGWAQGW